MELKVLFLLVLSLPLSAVAQFLPGTWTEQERSEQLKAVNREAIEERKLVERRAMEIKAAHQKKQQQYWSGIADWWK